MAEGERIEQVRDAELAKGFREGTERTVAPLRTLERVRPFMAQLGITRVADVTGLDRIGLPVFTVCRPNSRSVCVSQGKGLTRETAEASGLMESIECHHAEHPILPLLLGSVAELGSSRRTIDVDRLPRLSVSVFHHGLRMLWTPGVSLNTGDSSLVPYEVVHIDFRLPLPTGSGAFLMSSNGLASGNGAKEAISHAVCELIERDANTIFQVSGGMEQTGIRTDPRTVDDAACRHVLDSFENADMDLAIWETTTDIEIPCFMATVVDRDPHYPRPMPPVSGSGAHPRRHVALLRALTEAAQGRATIISGAREGMSERVFDAQAAVAAASDFRQILASTRATRSFRDAPDFEHRTFDGDIRHELETLARAGLEQVVVVNLTRPELGIDVVRAIIPGLEAMSEVRGYVFGARARQTLTKRASA